LLVIDKSSIGGGQRYVLDLVQRLDRSRFVPLVACSPGGPLVEEVRKAGAHCFTLPIKRPVSLAGVRALARLLREHRPAVMHANGLVAAVHCALAAGKAGKPPVIYSQHGLHYHNYGLLTRPLRLAAEGWVCRRVQMVVSCSEVDRRECEGRGWLSDGRSCVLSYGTDPLPLPSDERVRQMRAELGAADGPLLLAVGRLHPQKGFSYLLRAMAQVRPKLPSAVLALVGDGPLRVSLQALSSHLGLDANVRFLGFRNDLWELLAASNMVVISSLWEGLPYFLLQAMASERPIVCTRVGACADVLDEGRCGILVPPADEASLGEAVLSLARDRALAGDLAQCARKRALSHFRASDMTRQVESLYESIWGSGSHALEASVACTRQPTARR
jgi:glycosyltransferase involved in cell wall biosynthesis